MSDNSTALVLDWDAIGSRMYGCLGCPFCTYNTSENSEAVRRGIEMGGSLREECDHHKARTEERRRAEAARKAAERERVMASAEDRVLLEKAARAMGAKVIGWTEDERGQEVAKLESRFGDGFYQCWQPLHDNRETDCDGDALRLAVKRSLSPMPPTEHDPYATCGDESVFSDGDPYAATRRAIVRAAAAMEGTT